MRLVGTDPLFEMIVCVHDLSDPPDARGEELDSWMPHTAALPTLVEIAGQDARRAVPLRITSDDGFRSDYDLLLPWLLERGLACTFFIPTRFVGKTGRLTKRQIREMAGQGMRFGCHGAAHLDWTKTDFAAFSADVSEGKDALEQIIGTPVDMVAPPYGGINGHVLDHLAAVGFTEIHTTRPGLALRGEMLKPRNTFRPSNIAAIEKAAQSRGTLTDTVKCRLRRARINLQTWMRAA